MAAANSNSLNINVDRSKNEALNLQVLQRRDSNVMEIVSTASHVVVYAFDHDNKEWNRAEVEGTLFLVKRCTAPRFQLVVNNRLSTENFTVSLSAESHVDIQDTFLILRLSDKEIYGVWFYPEEDRQPIYKMAKKAIRALHLQKEQSPPVPSAGSTILGVINCQPPPSTIERTSSGSLLLPQQVATTSSRKSGTESIGRSDSGKKSLLIPSDLTTAFNQVSIKTSPLASPTVDKEALRQTLIGLLSNDSEFFNQIHAAYVQQLKKQ